MDDPLAVLQERIARQDAKCAEIEMMLAHNKAQLTRLMAEREKGESFPCGRAG